jgi:hypothetical protein
MRLMKHSTTDRLPPSTTPGDTSTGTIDRGPGTPHYTRHFRSLILPGLVSADALVPEWLRKRFRRTDTRASR